MNTSTIAGELTTSLRQTTTSNILYKSLNIPRKSELDVVGLGVGVLFGILGMAIAVYCVVKATSCREYRSASKDCRGITYFEQATLNIDPISTVNIDESEMTSRKSEDDILPSTSILRDSEISVEKDIKRCDEKRNKEFPDVQYKPIEGDAIEELKKMGIF